MYVGSIIDRNILAHLCNYLKFIMNALSITTPVVHKSITLSSAKI